MKKGCRAGGFFCEDEDGKIWLFRKVTENSPPSGRIEERVVPLENVERIKEKVQEKNWKLKEFLKIAPIENDNEFKEYFLDFLEKWETFAIRGDEKN